MMPKGSFWTTLKDTSGSWFNFLVLFENLGSQWSGRKNTKKVEEIKRAIGTWDWTPKGSFLKIQKLTIKLYAKKNKGLVTFKKKRVLTTLLQPQWMDISTYITSFYKLTWYHTVFWKSLMSTFSFIFICFHLFHFSSFIIFYTILL